MTPDPHHYNAPTTDSAERKKTKAVKSVNREKKGERRGGGKKTVSSPPAFNPLLPPFSIDDNDLPSY